MANTVLTNSIITMEALDVLRQPARNPRSIDGPLFGRSHPVPQPACITVVARGFAPVTAMARLVSCYGIAAFLSREQFFCNLPAAQHLPVNRHNTL
jgi:hypothetical protein